MHKSHPSQKMEQLGFIASSIAHDFNNLLTGIMGHASLALLKLPQHDESARLHMEQALKTAQYASILTAQLLAYSQAEQPETESLDLNFLIRETIELLATVLMQNVTLTFDFLPDLPPIEAVPAQLQQVIMNLAINATESITQEKGELVIKTRRTTIRRGYEPALHDGSLLPAGEYVYFAITDSGQGMDEATMAHIFDPFFSTKPHGQGIGLPAAYDIIKQHRGGIAIESQKNRGTTFTVFLPTAQRLPKYLPIH
jgi:signal transduction histidine kinase